MLAVLCFTAFTMPLLGVVSSVIIKDHAKAMMMWGLTADAITVL
jgi:hypothetical protein